MKERTCLLIEYTSAPLPLLCPSRVTPYLAMFLLLYRFTLSLSPPPPFAALRPVTSHNRPVDARVYAYSSYFNYSYTSYSSSRAPPSPPPLLPFHLRIDYARLSIFFLHRTASKLFFLSAPSPCRDPPPPHQPVPRSCPRTLTQAPNPTAVSLALCLLGRRVR